RRRDIFVLGSRSPCRYPDPSRRLTPISRPTTSRGRGGGASSRRGPYRGVRQLQRHVRPGGRRSSGSVWPIAGRSLNRSPDLNDLRVLGVEEHPCSTQKADLTPVIESVRLALGIEQDLRANNTI